LPNQKLIAGHPYYNRRNSWLCLFVQIDVHSRDIYLRRIVHKATVIDAANGPTTPGVSTIHG